MCLFQRWHLIRTTKSRWEGINVGVTGINKSCFFKGCSVESGEEKKKLVSETCCVAIVGDDVLIEPQTVWFFRPEVSFKQAHRGETYWSRAPLAAGPGLHCINVNGGLGVVGWDLPNPFPAAAPSFIFSTETAGIFQGFLAQWLMCNSSQPHLPPHSLIHPPPPTFSLMHFVCQAVGGEPFPSAFSPVSIVPALAVNTLWLLFAQCYSFTLCMYPATDEAIYSFRHSEPQRCRLLWFLRLTFAAHLKMFTQRYLLFFGVI